MAVCDVGATCFEDAVGMYSSSVLPSASKSLSSIWSLLVDDLRAILLRLLFSVGGLLFSERCLQTFRLDVGVVASGCAGASGAVGSLVDRDCSTMANFRDPLGERPSMGESFMSGAFLPTLLDGTREAPGTGVYGT